MKLDRQRYRFWKKFKNGLRIAHKIRRIFLVLSPIGLLVLGIVVVVTGFLRRDFTYVDVGVLWSGCGALLIALNLTEPREKAQKPRG